MLNYILKLLNIFTKPRIIIRGLFTVFSILLLTGCPAMGPDCVLADDWGDEHNVSILVNSRDKLTDSGMLLLGGEPLYMKTGGDIDLCPQNLTLDESTIPAIIPRTRTWQNTGFSVRKNEYFSIHVLGVNEESTPGSSSYVDRRGSMIRGGKGLYALIMDPGKTPGEVENSQWFWKDPTVGKDPEFFELYENDPSNGKGEGTGLGGFSGVAPKDGVVWLRYARTARKDDGSRNLSNSGDWGSRWSPWRGKFAWAEYTCAATCNPGMFLPACWTTVLLAPACIAGWMGYCGSSKLLPNMENCIWPDKDDDYWPGGGEHWVDENYSGNANGYEVRLTTSCPGTKGKYLEALILQDGDVTSTQVPVFTPAGCDPSDGACNVVVDKNGRPMTKPLYNLVPGKNISTIDMNPEHNVLVNSLGEFNDSVPRNGQLWFRIKDSIVKPSDLLANPAGCNISGNAAYSLPANDPTDCVQKVDSVANPDQKACYQDYITVNGVRSRNADICNQDILTKVTTQLSKPTNLNATYIEGCGFKNASCKPPKGFTGYDDNLGSYLIKVRTTKVSRGFSSALNSIIQPVKAIIFGECRNNTSLKQEDCNSQTPGAWKIGVVQTMYTKLIGNSATGGTVFSDAVRASMLLYVILYSMRFMLGMVEDAQREFIIKILQIAILQQMLAPSSWEFFNNNLFSIFINGTNELIAAIAGQFMGFGAESLVDPITGKVITDTVGAPVVPNNINPFAFVDITISRFFSHETWIKIAGLLFGSILGPVYILVIIFGMGYYIMAVLTALILYLLCIIGMGLQIMVAPIFISFLLFKRTKVLFDKWINYLLAYLAQPVFVFTALSIFNVFIYSAIYNLLHYDVCWQCILQYEADWYLFSFTLCFFKFYLPSGGYNLGSLPIQFFVIIIFVILTSAMYAFNSWMAKLATDITLGASAANLAALASSTLAKAAGSIAKKGKAVANLGASGAAAAYSAAKSKDKDGDKDKK